MIAIVSGDDFLLKIMNLMTPWIAPKNQQTLLIDIKKLYNKIICMGSRFDFISHEKKPEFKNIILRYAISSVRPIIKPYSPDRNEKFSHKEFRIKARINENKGRNQTNP